jgi:hypothetical protein
VRLNGAIGYITPKDMLAGRQQEIHRQRDRKLEAAREQRKIAASGPRDASHGFRVADHALKGSRCYEFHEELNLYRWPCHHRDTSASVRIVCLSVRHYSEFRALTSRRIS